MHSVLFLLVLVTTTTAIKNPNASLATVLAQSNDVSPQIRLARVVTKALQIIDHMKTCTGTNAVSIPCQATEREFLISVVAVSAANIGFLEEDNRLWTAEMDLEMDAVEKDCIEQETKLTKARNLAADQYMQGDPLAYIKDPPCIQMELQCEHLTPCMLRWACHCQHLHKRDYPATKQELRQLLDKDKKRQHSSPITAVRDVPRIPEIKGRSKPKSYL